MEYDPWRAHWTSSNERIAWRSYYPPILAWVALCACILAQGLTYISPRLRSFPRSVLSWLNYYNIYFCIYTLLRWSPSSPLHSSWALNPKANSINCNLIIFVEISTLSGSSACSALICLTLFLLVVLRIRSHDLESRRRYYWSYLVFVIIYPFGCAAISFTLQTGLTEGVKCGITNSTANILIRTPFVILFALQILTLGFVIRLTSQVSKSVHTSSTLGIPIKYVYVRFMATFVVQVFNVVPSQLNLIFPSLSANSAIWERFVLISHGTGPILDAGVMILGNVEVRNWVLETFKYLACKIRPLNWRIFPKQCHQNSSMSDAELYSIHKHASTCDQISMASDVDNPFVDSSTFEEEVKRMEEISSDCSGVSLSVVVSEDTTPDSIV